MILRDPASATTQAYDLIIVGGGIYGAMLALEAARHGRSALLLEKDDFGQHTSHNSLRILHGGLRYLQKLDLHRFHESVSERGWFLRNFPQYALPLPCLMPLYGEGARRPAILRIALWLNDFLSRDRNDQVPPDRHLLPGKVIDLEATRNLFSDVDTRGLKGGAVWYDACMPDSQRLLLEVLHWAGALGAKALNYVKATDLLQDRGKVQGVLATDQETGETYQYKAKNVVNAAGPWCREVAGDFDRDHPGLFRHSIAWNILFNKKALSSHALAIAPKKPGAHTYFLFPWKGMILAGTGHLPWRGDIENPVPSAEMIKNFIADLNMAIPNFNAEAKDVLRIFSGLLPAKNQDTAALAVREVFLDHSTQGGPHGLFSISGVKFTTSRLVAEKTIRQIFPGIPVRQVSAPYAHAHPLSSPQTKGLYDFNWRPAPDDSSWQDNLRKLVSEEAVLHLDDLILRRTSLGDNPARALEVAPAVCDIFPWNKSRCQHELQRLQMGLGKGITGQDQ